MAPIIRSAVVAFALTAGTAVSVAQSSPGVHVAAAPGTDLVARPGEGAARLRNQRQVVDPSPPPPTAPAAPTDLAAQVVALTNAERAAAGRAVLAAHPDLMEAALAHSRDQAAMGRMTHAGSDGSNAGTRIERAGYTWRTWAENVAYGFPTAERVVDAWMGSPGHRTNILNGSFAHIGVAAAAGSDGRLYWTMVLAA